jgi:hypothetical protein
LTGGIAHDFNNLLTPVIGGLEMIAESLKDRGSSGLRTPRSNRADAAPSSPPNC